MKNMNILVTGGAGYIGSHTVKLLMRAGYEPLVFDSLITGHRDSVLSPRFIKMDIADREALNDLFVREHFDLVLHFAGFLSVPESVAHPEKYYANNVTNTLNLLSAMRKGECKKIIFSSSAAVYGEPQRTPIDEDCPTQPVNPYGHSKLIIEEMLRWYFRAYGMSSISLRYFCAAGADPDGILGERHDPETHVTPLLLKALLSNSPFYIYGDDYPTSDGTCIRDYVHVTDIADAHVRAINLLNNSICEALNLGGEHGYSVQELIDTAFRNTGTSCPIVHAPRRPGDPHTLVASSHKARELLGWTPHYSDLPTIMRTTLDFFKTRDTIK